MSSSPLLATVSDSPVPPVIAVPPEEVELGTLVELPPVRTVEAKPVDPDAPPAPPLTLVAIPGVIWDFLCSATEWLLGGATMILLLAVVASIPVVQLLSLGYLLEVAGRIARTGNFAAGFIGYRQAARIGSVIVGIGVTLLPLWFISTQASSAAQIVPDGAAAYGWKIGLIVAAAFALFHVIAALYNGGRLRDFFWPLFQPFYGPAASAWALVTGSSVWEPWTWLPPLRLIGGLWAGEAYGKVVDHLWDFVVGLRLPYLFQLGLLGFVGTLIWIAIPALLLGVGKFDNPGVGFLAWLLGTISYSIVLLYLPFLQAHYAAEQNFWAMFDLSAVRAQFQRAPLLFWLALVVTLASSLPLYLLTAFAPPRELTWIPSVVFVLFMLPARFLTGWAVGCGRSSEEPAFFLWRWSFWLLELPVVVIYTLFIFFVPYYSVAGSAAHFQPHAFFVPSPFGGN